MRRRSSVSQISVTTGYNCGNSTLPDIDDLPSAPRGDQRDQPLTRTWVVAVPVAPFECVERQGKIIGRRVAFPVPSPLEGHPLHAVAPCSFHVHARRALLVPGGIEHGAL